MIGPTGRRRLAATAAAGFTLALLLAGPASAVPPGGPGPNTPGTSAEVSPTSLSAGDKISFTLRGFPAGETVNIKIDDGEVCGEAAVHGACVVYKKKISDGATSGSFKAPKELKPGTHTLRFLASKPIKGSGGGIEGFTLRSPEFTIVAAQKASSAPTKSSSAPVESSSVSSSSAPQATNEPTKPPKVKTEKKKEKKENAAEPVNGEAGIVTPEPVTAVVTGSGLSVAQAIGIGGGAVGLAAVIGGLTAWWRRGGVG